MSGSSGSWLESNTRNIFSSMLLKMAPMDWINKAIEDRKVLAVVHWPTTGAFGLQSVRNLRLDGGLGGQQESIAVDNAGMPYIRENKFMPWHANNITNRSDGSTGGVGIGVPEALGGESDSYTTFEVDFETWQITRTSFSVYGPQETEVGTIAAFVPCSPMLTAFGLRTCKNAIDHFNSSTFSDCWSQGSRIAAKGFQTVIVDANYWDRDTYATHVVNKFIEDADDGDMKARIQSLRNAAIASANAAFPGATVAYPTYTSITRIPSASGGAVSSKTGNSTTCHVAMLPLGAMAGNRGYGGSYENFVMHPSTFTLALADDLSICCSFNRDTRGWSLTANTIDEGIGCFDVLPAALPAAVKTYERATGMFSSKDPDTEAVVRNPLVALKGGTWKPSFYDPGEGSEMKAYDPDSALQQGGTEGEVATSMSSLLADVDTSPLRDGVVAGQSCVAYRNHIKNYIRDNA
jgi:hypothetical protein